MSETIRDRLLKVCDRLDELHRQNAHLRARMDNLEQQGITDANPHWRRKDDPNGKPDMLELVHPTGSTYELTYGRRREYIGTDEVKIQEALERVKRWGFYRKLGSDLGDNNAYIRAIENRVKGIEQVAFAKQAPLYDWW